MFIKFKKIVLASLIIFTVLTTGAWQSNDVVSAERQTTNSVETPLYPGLTWSSLGSSTENIRINIQGDSISVSGERFEAQEQFASDVPLPQDLANYYSNAELAKSGWASYDSFDGSDGVHYVFYHESGIYLSVEFLKCQSEPARTCVAIWKSETVSSQATASLATNVPENLSSANATSFSKTSPANGATGVTASNVTLKWEAYSTAKKYTYCLQESDCITGSVNWTSTYDTSVTRTNLSSNKTYHWQVRALICDTCTPKTWVYANSGTSWTFSTSTSKVTIIGNAGVAGATLSYVDGTTKKVTAGSDGSYVITVPNKWSGTLTPSKSGYMFTPTSASFSNLTASQTIQNFIATLIYTISGNVGMAGVTLSYTDGTPKTVVSDGSGNYSLVVTNGWNGTITPSYTCYSFTPSFRTYTNVTGSQTGQNYTVAFNPASGCANVNIKIGTASMGNYGVPAGGRVTPMYANVQTGPVKVSSSLPVFTSERALSGTYKTFNELMGVPNNQLTNHYWFPWYDNKDMSTWILVANPDSVNSAAVTIKIAGQQVYSKTLGPNGIDTPVFGTTQGGPVEVTSTAPIITSERALYGSVASFNEVMGYPDNRLINHYWFPWYDNKDMSTWVLVANPDDVNSATVTIKIAGQQVYSKTLGPNQVDMPTFKDGQGVGLQNGPVEVTSTAPIITSERALFGAYKTFNEVMGYPDNLLTNHYWFPWYDNKDMSTWVLVGNPDSVNSVTVTIKVAGQQVYSKSLGPNAIDTPVFGTTQNGPVEVTSTGSIFTSERALSGSIFSFNEVMGFPNSQLTTDYWFTWYDSKSMSTWILVGKP